MNSSKLKELEGEIHRVKILKICSINSGAINDLTKALLQLTEVVSQQNDDLEEQIRKTVLVSLNSVADAVSEGLSLIADEMGKRDE